MNKFHKQYLFAIRLFLSLKTLYFPRRKLQRDNAPELKSDTLSQAKYKIYLHALWQSKRHLILSAQRYLFFDDIYIGCATGDRQATTKNRKIGHPDQSFFQHVVFADQCCDAPCSTT